MFAFHLTGRRTGTDLGAVDPRDLRPVLLASYRDLNSLRYDFPIVLAEDATEPAFVHPLSGIMDGILRELDGQDGIDRVRAHVLRLEQQIRTLVAHGADGVLSDLWSKAAGRLGSRGDELVRESLDRARAALGLDGPVVDCTDAMPGRLISHAFQTAHRRKTRQFRARLRRVLLGLSDILQADFARSAAGRSAASLEASLGSLHGDVFDFEALSRVVGSTAATVPADDRVTRIRALMATLESQRFYSISDRNGTSAGSGNPYTFIFESCQEALSTYRQRLPGTIELARAMAVAELEIDGRGGEAGQPALAAQFGADDFEAQDLALFPDYLVLLRASAMDPAEQAALLEIFEAGLPMKVLVQTDDLLERTPAGHFTIAGRSRHLAAMALALSDLYVLQASASHLFQFHDRLMRGISFAGPALFSVFSGTAHACGDLPPYLVAAAAMDSRAFPAFVYDPGAGPDWASRFDVQTNPAADADWPIRQLEYEDAVHQRTTETAAFTLVDFLGCDRRTAGHLALVRTRSSATELSSVGDALATDAATTRASVPCVWMVDRDDILQRVIVDDKLIRDARACLETWHSLQELGGIHNSHARRALARERQGRDGDQARRQASTPAVAPEVPAVAGAAPARDAAGEADAGTTSAEQPAVSRDEPYIETPRCSSCNECIQINGRMFAYNDNKQAYIADLSAGTYRQLVEAAESCQVSVIHPGKPRDPDESGIDELLRRAEPFF
jgi:ferredoxin